MHNEGTFNVDERFMRTFKNKIYKYMTSVSKNVYIEKLGDTVNKYKNKYHRMKNETCWCKVKHVYWL